jgi:hypothetical protein
VGPAKKMSPTRPGAWLMGRIKRYFAGQALVHPQGQLVELHVDATVHPEVVTLIPGWLVFLLRRQCRRDWKDKDQERERRAAHVFSRKRTLERVHVAVGHRRTGRGKIEDPALPPRAPT